MFPQNNLNWRNILCGFYSRDTAHRLNVIVAEDDSIRHYRKSAEGCSSQNHNKWSVFSHVYRSIAQVQQYTWQISNNAPFCNRNVHISVTKWCVVGYGTSTLWDLWNRSIVTGDNWIGYYRKSTEGYRNQNHNKLVRFSSHVFCRGGL